MGHWPAKGRNSPTTFGGLKRSQLMARVRSAGNRTTELRLIDIMRKHHIAGWRRHWPLVGHPDFVWPKKRTAVFVDGCFWHGHNCGRNLTSQTNVNEWAQKIIANRLRDRRVNRQLKAKGWKVLRLWECALRDPRQQFVSRLRASVSTEPSGSKENKSHGSGTVLNTNFVGPR